MLNAVDQISNEFLSDWANRLMVDAALSYFMTFFLVMIRFSGLMLIGPFFGHTAIPMNVKFLFVFSMALIITPALPNIRDRGFQKLDINQDGVLSGDETPRVYRESIPSQAMLQQSGRYSPAEVEVTPTRFRAAGPVPSTMFDLLWLVGTELLLGMTLGLGVVIILTGLQLAGESFDQQTGTALSEIFNPALGTSISPTGQLLFLLGTTAMLTMSPIDGHLMMLSSLLKTFEVLPVGMATVDIHSLDLMRHLMSQSMVIAIQIAAPLLASMALLSVTMGFLGYTVPQINVLVLGFPIRAMLALTILTVTLSGATDSILEVFVEVLDQITATIIASGQ